MGRIESLKPTLIAFSIRLVVRLFSWTYRVEHRHGREQLTAVLERGQPVILAFWHDRLFFMSAFLREKFLRRGRPLTVFASRSRDGELGARLVRMWGGDVVRGSASRGGLAGLRALYRSVTGDGSSPVITPDGPRGPRHEAKSGTAVLSQMSQAPIVTFAYAADRAWILGSWDRMAVPKPFSRIAVAVGDPQTVPTGVSGEELDRWNRRIGDELDALQRIAEQQLDGS